MKFSSIFLIAAGLAAIAGSTIAAPSPLHARALPVVVDDNLFKRQPAPTDDWRENHRAVARALNMSAREKRTAAAEARTTAEKPTLGIKTQEEWRTEADDCEATARANEAKASKHYRTAREVKIGPVHNEINDDHAKAAKDGRDAKMTVILAKIDRP